MALSEANESRNKYDGVQTVGGTNLSASPGLDLSDLDVADDQLDAGSIGPNNPRPGGGRATTVADILPLA